MRRIAAVAAAAVVTSAFALFAGAASAGGPGNGGGSGNGQGSSQAQASAGAQVKASAQAQAKAKATTQTQVKVSAVGRAQAKGHAASHPSSATTVAVGVKSSQATTAQHSTFAPAASTKTKLYGNGKTAGQIAMQNGANAATVLHGPGNSQPHKTSACPGRHEVDVHALKAHGGNACVSTSAQGQAKTSEHVSAPAAVSTEQHVTICHATGSSTHPFVVIAPSASGVFHGHLGHQEAEDVVPTFQFQGQLFSQNMTAVGQAMLSSSCQTTAPAVVAAAATQQAVAQTTQTATAAAPATLQTTAVAPKAAAAGVKAATQPISATKKLSAPKNTSGVKGAAAQKATTGALGNKLPFTGLPLWIALIAAGGLISIGGVLRFTAASIR